MDLIERAKSLGHLPKRMGNACAVFGDVSFVIRASWPTIQARV
jgi:hypothetical protein